MWRDILQVMESQLIIGSIIAAVAGIVVFYIKAKRKKSALKSDMAKPTVKPETSKQ